MIEQYRKEYEGEFVITEVKIVNGKKHQEREFIDNPITVNTISGRATCVSNGNSSSHFQLARLMKHHGVLNTLSLNVYATGDLYKQVHANFHVTFNTMYLQDLIDKKLTEEIIVYTSTTQCINYPGEFFIVPHAFKSSEEAVAAYLAAFDGHSEIFLLGYDEYMPDGSTRRTKMIETVGQIIRTYSTTRFYHVIDQGSVPAEWMPYRNLREMSVREYISYCDIS